MASTLRTIIDALRAENFVDSTNVNYGYTDGRSPPYINVMDYEHTLEYDTGGVALKEARFKVLVIDKTVDEAEAVAETVDDFVNNNTTLTAKTIGCFQESYRVGQLDEKLYQFGVEIGYKLIEDPSK